MSLKDSFTAFLLEQSLLQRLIVHMVNNRIQEFSDPLTTTLILLATTPAQLVFCESGLILFKTCLLPIFPYTLLLPAEKQLLQQWINNTSDAHESCDSSGQFTLTLPLQPKQPLLYLCKKTLLMSFVHVMRHHNGTFNAPAVCATLCNNILQRFMANVPVSSDIMNVVLLQLNIVQPPATILCPLLRQPSDAHYVPIKPTTTTTPVVVVAVKRKKQPASTTETTSYKKKKKETPSL